MDMLAATDFLARSSTLTSVGWIGYIIIGAIAGWIAGKIVKGGGSGIVMNIVIGIVGALVGGWLCDKLGRKTIYQWDMLVYAVGMALLVFAVAPWMIFLGFGKYVRADKIYALEPLGAGLRGHGARTRVWVDGIAEPIVASR